MTGLGANLTFRKEKHADADSGRTSRGTSKSPSRGRKPSGRGRTPSRRPSPQKSQNMAALADGMVQGGLLNGNIPTGVIKPGEKPVRIGSLLGLTQVGQCVFIEYENDMIIVDAGMEFSADETLGADYIIPDISYIKKNKKKLRGILISHGHLDHVGALRDILPELGFPMVYTTPLTLGIIKKTFNDPRDVKKIRSTIVRPDIDVVKLGCFTIEFAEVNHNIPETYAMAIHTPKGMIVNSSDFKFDHTPAMGRPSDLPKLARFGSEGVKLFIGDSLGANRPGWAKSEKIIGESLDSIIKDAQGRVFIATFASNIGRVIQIVQSAVRYNKIVFITGRSMINNIEICQELGYIVAPKGSIRKLGRGSDEVNTLPDQRVLVLSTGAQGEEFAALTRMGRDDHPQVQLRRGDSILLSSSVIPGNEKQMDHMLNNLAMKEVRLITSQDMDIHASGHGYAEDHKLILALLRPEYFLPYYLTARFRYSYRRLALDMGMCEERVMMPHENGAIIEMYDDVVRVADKKLQLRTVLIDGKGQGHLSGEYVIKARKIMARSGFLGLIFKVDTETKDLVGNIQIESRGFVYSSEVRKIHTQIVTFARQQYDKNKKNKNTRGVKDNLKQMKEQLGLYLEQIIGRSPIVVPSFVYINSEGESGGVESLDDDAIVGMTLEEQGGTE